LFVCRGGVNNSVFNHKKLIRGGESGGGGGQSPFFFSTILNHFFFVFFLGWGVGFVPIGEPPPFLGWFVNSLYFLLLLWSFPLYSHPFTVIRATRHTQKLQSLSTFGLSHRQAQPFDHLLSRPQAPLTHHLFFRARFPKMIILPLPAVSCFMVTDRVGLSGALHSRDLPELQLP